MMNGMISMSGESWMTTLDAMSQMASGVAAPEGATSLANVMTGTPTAPKPVGTLFAINDTKALKPGLKPRPIRIAAGIATAVPNPAMPSSKPPKPQTRSNTMMPRSFVREVNCFLITSISPLSSNVL